MKGKIRLGCSDCDRQDFDGVDEIPPNWLDIHKVQSFKESIREVDFDDLSRSPLDWQTHLGTCPECQSRNG
jgi:hypothetical protein